MTTQKKTSASPTLEDAEALKEQLSDVKFRADEFFRSDWYVDLYKFGLLGPENVPIDCNSADVLWLSDTEFPTLQKLAKKFGGDVEACVELLHMNWIASYTEWFRLRNEYLELRDISNRKKKDWLAKKRNYQFNLKETFDAVFEESEESILDQINYFIVQKKEEENAKHARKSRGKTQTGEGEGKRAPEMVYQ